MKLDYSFYLRNRLFGIGFCFDVEALDVLHRSAGGCIGVCI